MKSGSALGTFYLMALANVFQWATNIEELRLNMGGKCRQVLANVLNMFFSSVFTMEKEGYNRQDGSVSNTARSVPCG